jgi:hypothetical protein
VGRQGSITQPLLEPWRESFTRSAAIASGRRVRSTIRDRPAPWKLNLPSPPQPIVVTSSVHVAPCTALNSTLKYAPLVEAEAGTATSAATTTPDPTTRYRCPSIGEPSPTPPGNA